MSGFFPALYPRLLAIVAVLLATCVANASGTNDLSGAELEGRALAERLLAQLPGGNTTNVGILQLRAADGVRRALPVETRTIRTATGWTGVYEVTTNIDGPNFFVQISHQDGPNSYAVGRNPTAAHDAPTAGQPALFSQSFADSDFWIGDLGLEFFHWPAQKILKKEFHRNCACMVLESTNPAQGANGYSRVVSWIDEESLGIVEAYAYDAQGKKLKNFYPKSLEKVNGQYQVESMVMENLQTGSRSVFKFDLDK